MNIVINVCLFSKQYDDNMFPDKMYEKVTVEYNISCA